MSSSENEKKKHWYVMRDLKRSNAKLSAYKHLQNEHIEVFTPMRCCFKIINGQRVRKEVPFIQDLLFVHDMQEVIDSIIRKTPTLQYRYQKGGGYRKPMIVSDADMERFICVIRSSDNPKYYLPEDIKPEMYGRKIRIIGGVLDGYQGCLLTTRGSKVKRLLIQLPNLFSVGVEVNLDMIEFIQEI